MIARHGTLTTPLSCCHVSCPQAVTLGVYDKLTASRFAFGLGTMSVFFTLGGRWRKRQRPCRCTHASSDKL